jgi:hypothetical protein
MRVVDATAHPECASGAARLPETATFQGWRAAVCRPSGRRVGTTPRTLWTAIGAQPVEEQQAHEQLVPCGTLARPRRAAPWRVRARSSAPGSASAPLVRGQQASVSASTAPRALGTRTRRPPGRDRLPPRSCICGKAAARPSLPPSMRPSSERRAQARRLPKHRPPAAAFRPTEQRMDARSGAPRRLVSREAGVSPCAPARRPFRASRGPRPNRLPTHKSRSARNPHWGHFAGPGRGLPLPRRRRGQRRMTARASLTWAAVFGGRGTRVTGGLTILAGGPPPPRGASTPSDRRA